MKKIVICIKQVPASENVKIDPVTNTLIRDANTIINPSDENALECALQFKDQNPETKLLAITMGPPQAADVLRHAISLGVDEAVLLSDRAFAGADAWATAYTLAKGIQKIVDADLIICGKQAIDGDTGQVGPGVAEFLNISHVALVTEAKQDAANLLAKRTTENGHEWVSTTLPALITVTSEMNTPRYPSLKGKMKAKSAAITTWSAADIQADPQKIGLIGSPTRVSRIFTPEEIVRNTQIFSGDASTCAKQLAEQLKNLKVCA